MEICIQMPYTPFIFMQKRYTMLKIMLQKKLMQLHHAQLRGSIC